MRAVYAWTDEIEQWIENSGRYSLGPSRRRMGLSGEEGGNFEPDGVAVPGTPGGPPPAASARDEPGSIGTGGSRPRWPLILAVTVAAGLAVLAGAWWWGNLDLARRTLSGRWAWTPGGILGTSPEVGRLDTGSMVGPGSAVGATLVPRTGRWSGGFEIHQDELHRTQIALSPADHMVHVRLMPTGRLLTLGAPSLQPGKAVRLALSIESGRLLVALGDREPLRVPLEPWEVRTGHLYLVVGYGGDEYLRPRPGACLFRGLRVTTPPGAVTDWMARPTDSQDQVTSRYRLTVDNVDDQVDLLLDGKRLLTAAFRDRIVGFDLDPYLTPGEHVLTARVFNRKWTTTYAVALSVDGRVAWRERCGTVDVDGGGCPDLGSRTGLVRTLEYRFSAH